MTKVSGGINRTEKDNLSTLIKTRKAKAKADKVKHSENVKTWRRQKSTQTALHKTSQNFSHQNLFTIYTHLLHFIFSDSKRVRLFICFLLFLYNNIPAEFRLSFSLSLSLLVKYFSSLIFACLRQSENSFNKEANTISHACRNRPHSHSSFKAENEVRILPGL